MSSFMSSFIKTSSLAVAVGLSLGIVSTNGLAHDHSHSAAIKKAVEDNKWRKEGDSARDPYRHPAKVLEFFGVTASSAVGEVNPGGMWYSRILGPLLKEKGLYVGLEHHPASYASSAGRVNYANRNLRTYADRFTQNKDMFGERAIGANIMQLNSPVKDGSLDVVMIVRAMHNWQNANFLVGGLADVHAKLKEGGTLGIVQHREPETSSEPTSESAKRGRWKQSELIKVVEAHGFKLVASSEMNANPKDDGTMAVWMLPPNLRGPEEGKEERRKIGESDRMTLKFVKVSKK